MLRDVQPFFGRTWAAPVDPSMLVRARIVHSIGVVLCPRARGGPWGRWCGLFLRRGTVVYCWRGALLAACLAEADLLATDADDSGGLVDTSARRDERWCLSIPVPPTLYSPSRSRSSRGGCVEGCLGRSESDSWVQRAYSSLRTLRDSRWRRLPSNITGAAQDTRRTQLQSWGWNETKKRTRVLGGGFDGFGETAVQT